jgi:hypothetical protein
MSSNPLSTERSPSTSIYSYKKQEQIELQTHHSILSTDRNAIHRILDFGFWILDCEFGRAICETYVPQPFFNLKSKIQNPKWF